MRIHSDTLTADDVTRAAEQAGVTLIECTEKGSKSRRRAFNVYFSGSGRRGGQYGNALGGNIPTATWDEWGIVLGHLFTIDPYARIAGVYESGEHFNWATGNRFDTLAPGAQHLKHNWLSGDRNAIGQSTTGRYYVRACKCGAVIRWMAPGRTFAELANA